MTRALACLVLGPEVFLSSIWTAAGAEIVVAPRAERDEPVHKCGERARFTINVSEDGKPVTEGDVLVTFPLDEGGKSARRPSRWDRNPRLFLEPLRTPGSFCARLRWA